MMCSMIQRPPGLTTDVRARTLHLGFDVLQNICLCLTEAEAYQWLTCCRVLLHEAPSVVRWGPIRIEQFNDVLYKFVRLKGSSRRTYPRAHPDRAHADRRYVCGTNGNGMHRCEDRFCPVRTTNAYLPYHPPAA